MKHKTSEDSIQDLTHLNSKTDVLRNDLHVVHDISPPIWFSHQELERQTVSVAIVQKYVNKLGNVMLVKTDYR